MDDKQSTNSGLRELALFAGAGGGILGGKLIGWRTVCGVERDAYAAQVLAQRQNDGILEPFPIWSDVCSFDGKPWRGIVDVVSGGFPCQDISAAGKGAGIEGKRSSMWGEMARIIGEVRPRYAIVENSPMLVSRGLAVVISDFAAIGYDAKWMCLSAQELGANHIRDRIWILASDTNSDSKPSKPGNDEASRMQGVCENDANPDLPQCERAMQPIGIQQKHTKPSNSHWWKDTPEFNRMDDGVASRLDKARLKAIGNGQVPICMATSFQRLIDL